MYPFPGLSMRGRKVTMDPTTSRPGLMERYALVAVHLCWGTVDMDRLNPMFPVNGETHS